MCANDESGLRSVHLSRLDFETDMYGNSPRSIEGEIFKIVDITGVAVHQVGDHSNECVARDQSS